MAAKDSAKFSWGKPASTQERRIKVALMGRHSTGKTTWWCEAAREYPDKLVLCINTEPEENLMEILEGYPDVLKRTHILPDKTQMAWIEKRGKQLSGWGYTGPEVARCEFIIDYIYQLMLLPDEEIQKLFIVLDTGSYVRKRLGHFIMDAMDKKDVRFIDPQKGQMNFGPVYRKFNIMMERLMKMSCHVILTARVEPKGQYIEGKGYQDTPGAEKAEWGDESNLRSTIWYDAATVIHLFKSEIDAKDENNTVIKVFMPDGSFKIQKKIIRWATLEKYKAKQTIVPIFFDISPKAIFKWISDNK